ncbi:L,D-transpeptidase [Bacillus cereus]|uniref:L,D-transpeptidase n=1 Tax=Bacillus cereus TaxID=1396 RepID=UPI003013071F
MKTLYKFLFVLTLVVPCVLWVHATEAYASTDKYIVIKREEHKLYYVKNKLVIKSFPVSTGRRENPTPTGRFTVVYKEQNRPFYKRQIAGGAPNNPLGTRWIGLNIKGTNGNTYGIHGTNQAGTIGMKISDGCIRMNNADVEWLYNQVEKGTTVIIK